MWPNLGKKLYTVLNEEYISVQTKEEDRKIKCGYFTFNFNNDNS